MVQLSEEEIHKWIENRYKSLHNEHTVHLVMDFIICLVIFISIYVFKYKLNQKVKEMD